MIPTNGWMNCLKGNWRDKVNLWHGLAAVKTLRVEIQNPQGCVDAGLHNIDIVLC